MNDLIPAEFLASARTCRTLIDGYNLIFAVGLGGRPGDARFAERARAALLQELAQRMPPADRARTVVVFDAALAPRGLPAAAREFDVVVLFAVGRPNADDLMEELLAAHREPRLLAVVSSDHRVQRAAKRCGAAAHDSEPWYDALVADHECRMREEAAPPPRPDADNAADERKSGRTPPAGLEEGYNPFPPGYGADLRDEDL